MNISRHVYTLLIFGVSFLHAPLNAADLMDIYQEAVDQDAQYAAARAEHRAAQEKCLRVEQDYFLVSPSQGYLGENS